MEGNFLTISGVAEMLHVHENTVRRWSNQGVLKAYRIGNRRDRRFVRQDIVQFILSNADTAQRDTTLIPRF